LTFEKYLWAGKSIADRIENDGKYAWDYYTRNLNLLTHHLSIH